MVNRVFAQITPAKGYLYPVKVYSKYGYINAEGKVIVEPQYWRARDFLGGYGLVLIGDSAVGLVNSSGNLVYESAKPIPGRCCGYELLASDECIMIGYQFVRSDTQIKGGFIDPERKQITAPDFFRICAFHNGLAKACNDANLYPDTNTLSFCATPVTHPVFGYVNRSGRYKIAPAYTEASSFYHGYAIVKYKPDDTLSEIIDTTGAKAKLEDILDDSVRCFYYFFTNEHIDAYNEEYPAYYTFNQDFLNSFIQYEHLHRDKNGKLLLPPEHKYAYEFSEDIADFNNFDDSLQHTFMTLYDTLISHEAYKNCKPFHEGLAAVEINGKWGFIDKQGKCIIEPAFEYTWDGLIFKGGIAKVKYNDKICYINKSGEIIWAGIAGNSDW